MAEWDKLAFSGQLVASLLAKFAQCDLFDCFDSLAKIIRLRRSRLRSGVGGVDSCGGKAGPGYSVNLTGGHFPDRFADWDSFLANQNDFTVVRHRRNHDSSFAVDDRPRTWLTSPRCLNLISHNFDM